MAQYVVDTHALLWYLTADERIGKESKRILDKAEAGENEIILPAIVLIEAIEVIKKKRVIYNADELLFQISERSNFKVKSLDWEIITLYKNYPFAIPKDAHDRIIIITAQYFGNLPIVTKDKEIKEVYSPTVW